MQDKAPKASEEEKELTILKEYAKRVIQKFDSLTGEKSSSSEEDKENHSTLVPDGSSQDS